MDAQVLEERGMLEPQKRGMALFVDKARPEHWIVRDQDGLFWSVPSVANPWENRQPFYPTEDTKLEPVPGHYKYVLGLPLN
jgi:hypothetical protein